MTDLSAEYRALANYRPTHKVRFVTAASLFDGHDAAINIMRRILQSMGTEVIHLGHNRSVDEVVTAALQEDVQGIAISSYQGGHVEYFKYMVDLLKQRGGSHIQVFGGGGGVIVPAEIRELQDYGVARIYSPEDGQRMGLPGMIGEMVMRCDKDVAQYAPRALDAIQGHGEQNWRALAQLITAIENGSADADLMKAVRAQADTRSVPVLGITGTGGAGKSSLTDELVRRLRLDQDDNLRVAIISIDPSRRKSGGALLGDRIRMNAISPWQQGPRVYMRSLATRDFGSEISAALPDVIGACKAAGFDLVIVETSGIGQGDAAIVPHVDVPLYVMTPEFGAASQLEKIDMLDFAQFVAINKFDRKGAADALRDVAKQVQRNKEAFGRRPEEMPVFGTMAARFNDDGVTALFQALKLRLAEIGLRLHEGKLPLVNVRHGVPAALLRHGDLVSFLRRENLPGYFPSPPGSSRSSATTRTRRACSPARATPSAPTAASSCSRRGSRPPACPPRSTRSPSTGATPTAPRHLRQGRHSGVSIATLDDMKELYSGFDLCDPTTSVSMTINGPAPTILAMFLNTVIDQRLDACSPSRGTAASRRTEAASIRAWVLANVRGTVQADILKEDQAQNTCIFSTEFALRMMGDIQEYFIDQKVRNFYSVSISGYHIAEAGANPISQLAFTLANGFTFVEYYLARGMNIDDFAPNLSFFFSNGMDPEYAVIGRVARRIWARPCATSTAPTSARRS
jgi:methylmalonyl-CoA mutase cobalamin-binding domain/chain